MGSSTRRVLAAGAAVFAMAAMWFWSAQAVAGVTPEVSRVVFPAGAAEQSLQVFNVNAYPVLVQAWVDEGDITAVPQQSKAPVIVLPPIFRMGPGDQTSLRLINAGGRLPDDRESSFWLNLYEIPATPKDASANEQRVTVTMRTQIKVFLRPDKLACPPGDVPGRLEASLARAGGKLVLTIVNPTPYHATIGTVQVGFGGATQQDAPDMLAPFSRARVLLDSLPGNPGDRAIVRFSVIGDDGNAVVEERTVAVGARDADDKVE